MQLTETSKTKSNRVLWHNDDEAEISNLEAEVGLRHHQRQIDMEDLVSKERIDEDYEVYDEVAEIEKGERKP